MKLLFLLILFALIIPSNGQIVHTMRFDRFSHYESDAWVTYAPATVITSIDIGDDYVYFGSEQGGILRYHLYDKFWDFPLTTSNGLRSNFIIAVVFDPASRQVFARTPKGVDVFNTSLGYFEPAPENILPTRAVPSEEEVNSFKESQSFRFPEFYRPADEELPNFFTLRNYLFNLPNEIFDPFNRIFKLTSDRVSDKFGNLWLATNGLGIARSEVNTWTLITEQHSIPSIAPRDLFLDRNGIWIGGLRSGQEPSGITFWNDSLDAWYNFESPFISDMHNDNCFVIAGNKDFVFFGTNMGLLSWNKKERTWKSSPGSSKLYTQSINDLLLVKSRLYIASDRGMFYLSLPSLRLDHPQDNTLNNYSINKITSLDSTVLLSTDYGLYEYYPKADRFEFFETKSALSDFNDLIARALDNQIWFAGNEGIFTFNQSSGEWLSFTQLQFQLDAHYNDIAFTKGNIWFATTKGLLKYNIKRDHWYLYTTRDGLASNIIYHIDPDRDTLWLSTEKGITIFRWAREGRQE